MTLLLCQYWCTYRCEHQWMFQCKCLCHCWCGCEYQCTWVPQWNVPQTLQCSSRVLPWEAPPEILGKIFYSASLACSSSDAFQESLLGLDVSDSVSVSTSVNVFLSRVRVNMDISECQFECESLCGYVSVNVWMSTSKLHCELMWVQTVWVL